MNILLAREILNTLEVGAIRRDSATRLGQFRPADWDAILSWLRRSGLALYWWSQLKSSGKAKAVPEKICNQLDNDLRENTSRLCAMQKEFQEIILLLEHSEVPYAVLKGFALVPEYCPDPALRSQYDFDFLVSADSLPRLDKSLRDRGFIQKLEHRSYNPAVYFHSAREPVLPNSLDNIFSPELHRPVEIHCCLWQLDADKIRFTLSETSLSRAVIKTWNGTRFFCLPPEEMLLFQVLHTFRHILNNWCRISLLLELAVFLHQHAEQEQFWSRFEKLVCRDDRLMEAAGVVFSLSTGLFQSAVPNEARAFTINRLTTASAFWLRRYGFCSAVQNFSASKSSLYLHGLFIDNKADWREVRRRRLLPLRKPAIATRATTGNRMSRLATNSRRLLQVFGRVWFHAAAAAEYLCGLPAWRRVLKHPTLIRAGEMTENLRSQALE